MTAVTPSIASFADVPLTADAAVPVPTPDAVADFAATLGTRSPHWVMNRPLADSDETARELRSYSGSAYA